MHRHAFIFTALIGTACGVARANSPPATPVVTEPAMDGQVVNPADVHMECGLFSDPDLDDTHRCTDWEIWLVSSPERVWVTACIGGVERLHTHLGDGVFEGSHAGRSELFTDTDYRLRVRHRDGSDDPPTEWSAWGERLFHTGPPTAVFPLVLDDVADAEPVEWIETEGLPLVLPAGVPAPGLRLESALGALLLDIRGYDGETNQLENPPALGTHVAARVRLSAGGLASLALPDTDLTFTDSLAQQRTIYLPAATVNAGTDAYLWVAASGATYFADPNDVEPEFSVLARSAPVPWSMRAAGYRVEVFATGFQLPVNIAFVPSGGLGRHEPFCYVSELYGTIKAVYDDGTSADYVSGLLNYDPTGIFPGSGEQGLSGIVVDPDTGDIFATLLYDAAPPNGPHYPKVLRFSSADGGHTAATQTTILDMPGETQGQSHFISNVTIGPDGKLYVHLGDGYDYTTAQDLDSFRGKIVRMNFDGSPCADNPFYDVNDGINSRDYIYAYGFRNPFGGAWRALDGVHYEVEDGPSVDRFASVVAGRNYLWNNTDASMMNHAIYNWSPAAGVVNIAFVQPGTFGGSGFPAGMWDHAFVTESGPTWSSGPQVSGKRILEMVLDPNGALATAPKPFVEYIGSGKATCVALAAGPDGLYFSDFYKDEDYASPIDRGSNLLRIRFAGAADFTADATYSPQAPMSVQFTDLTSGPAPTAWTWEFGDGQIGEDQNPLHVYQSPGVYDVRLSVVTAAGQRTLKRSGFIVVGDSPANQHGLLANYFGWLDLTDLRVTRVDPAVSFNWGTGSPHPAIPPDSFSVRWEGRVTPEYSETYTFFTRTDDGVRLWVNGVLLVDRWQDQAPTEASGALELAGGQSYPLVMEYYESLGGATAELRWESAHQPKQIIPPECLEPPAATADLALALDAAPNPALAGGPLEYTLTVANLGPDTAHGVWLNATLPGGLTLIDCVPSQGFCDPNGLAVTSYLGSILPGGEATLQIATHISANGGGIVTATASVALNEPDDSTMNNVAAADVTIDLPPGISEQSGDVVACVGAAAQFEVTAYGYPPPTYQWRRDGDELTGATEAIFVLPAVDVDDVGVYDVVIRNAVGEITSEPKLLTVDNGPIIDMSPVDTQVYAGGAVTLSVAAHGAPPLTYQWRHNAGDIEGATTQVLTLDPVALADAGTYDVVAATPCAATTSAPATLTVRPHCGGDSNCDGQVNFGDINRFVDAILQGVYCDATGANSDLNGDDGVDFGDINGFVDLLTENSLPLVCP